MDNKLVFWVLTLVIGIFLMYAVIHILLWLAINTA